MYGHVASTYQQVGIKTADPGRLVIMCYDGAIKYLKMAIAFYVPDSLERKAEAIVKAMDFIGELNRALDFERGGEIARNLHSLYNYMTRRITEGDLKRDIGAFEEIINILDELRSAWLEIIDGSAKNEIPGIQKPNHQQIRLSSRT
jgi:flagellar protein FliS